MLDQSQLVSKVVKLDANLADRLERLGECKDRSPHWLMKEAIAHYVEEEEYNERLKQETVARWQEAENGRIVSHQAVTAWLDTWGTEAESKRPQCGS